MEARRRRILSRQRHQSQGLRDKLSHIHLVIMTMGLLLACGGAYLVTENISPTETFSMIAGGTLVAVISFFGWFGTLHEHAGYLKTYCGVVGMILVGQGVGLLLTFMESDNGTLEHWISQVWGFFLDHDPLVLMDIEHMLQCCGYDSAQDRQVPVTCQKGRQGCKVVGMQWIERWQWSLIFGWVLLVMIQVCLLLANAVTLVMVERETREEASEDRLQKQHVIRYGWMINDHDHDYGTSTGPRPYYHSSRDANRRSNPSLPPPSPPHYGSLSLG